MIVSESWDKILKTQFSEPYIWGINKQIVADAAKLCPKPADIWNAFKATPFEQVKVCLIGQSPYYTGEANGLSFSATKITPSLKVVFRELFNEFGQKREDPNLIDWANQGVLLLNSVLTTTYGNASAHSGIGWEKLTGYILARLAKDRSPKVFMLWGKDAKDLGDRHILPNLNGSSPHLILKAIHPQAENYGDGTYTFTGCGHFRKANDFLGEHKRGRIKWI